MVRIWAVSCGGTNPTQYQEMWPEWRDKGIISIGCYGTFSIHGLNRYEIRDKISDIQKENIINGTLTLGSVNRQSIINENFNTISIGDIIIARVGKQRILGIGKVTSETKFYEEGLTPGRSHYNYRNIEWIKKCEITPIEIFNRFYLIETVENLWAKCDYSYKNFEYDENRKDDLKRKSLVKEIFCKFGLIDDCEEINRLNNSKGNKVKSLNQILYGPPGTGKTYHTAQRAVEICNGQAGEDRENIMVEYKKLVEEGKVVFVTFHQSYGYEEFVEGLKPKLDNEKNHEDTLQSVDSGQVSYHISSGVFKEICSKASENKNKNYVIIIDEINRGNISKIFGELITLIEDDKREGEANAISVTLPYSKQTFSVPKNVYIIGTMNTADRSLAQVDTALRRRFHFEPMMPDPEVLNDIVIENINIEEMLKKINERIAVLYDREHTIGHAYFTKLKDSKKNDGTDFTPVEKFEELKLIFRNKIIPLLEEYFFDDWHKIRLVLGDNQKQEKYQFIHEVDNNDIQKKIALFGDNNQLENELPKSYQKNEKAFEEVDSFKGIYLKLNSDTNA